ncbi:UNVERIFIED_CONTAM: hypothetical protein RMT77_003246 [Armadillidium vulgare]
MKKANEKNVNNKQKSKNNVKKKKDNTKSSIDSPFSLEWPSIDYGNYSQLVSCLKQSFGNYLTTIKRTKELEENTESTLVKDAKNHTKKLLTKADPACIIFGYNAVMRGLEKEKIKTVLVNADVKPDMIIKSFIPICNLRSIPLIPIKNLSGIFVKEVRIKSTIAVGFTLSACEKEGPFHNLHLSCCRALGYDNCEEDLSNKELSKPEDKKQVQLENSKQTKANQILSYHLKRENRSNRVFVPPKKENTFDMSFIKLDKSEPPKLSPVTYGPKVKKKRKAATVFKEKTTLPEVSELSFFIDVDKDVDMEDEEEQNNDVKEQDSVDDDKLVQNKCSTARYFEAFNSPTTSESAGNSHYLPAKIKKIRANSKRHL